jgi:hypothetical protein
MEQKVAAYPIAEELLDKFIEERMWTPEYARYTKSGN